ncbi:hypothetical protein [Metabacillus sp. RGM 3146]|uniref:glycosyl-4,4'-diaponeurosporenoate acyltransferase CrtO family protein n=1 Tax=Metabacillus sp. RGM 3146 TaxID=3401092 RepID=UPI003B9B9847
MECDRPYFLPDWYSLSLYKIKFKNNQKPSWLYKERAFEKRGKFYEALDIKAWKDRLPDARPLKICRFFDFLAGLKAVFIPYFWNKYGFFHVFHSLFYPIFPPPASVFFNRIRLRKLLMIVRVRQEKKTGL